MSLSRNHERYYGPTACIAIRRADRGKRRIGKNSVSYFIESGTSEIKISLLIS